MHSVSNHHEAETPQTPPELAQLAQAPAPEKSPAQIAHEERVQQAVATEQRITELKQELEALEKQREKTVVEMLPFDGAQLAAASEKRYEERMPAALRQVEGYIKQLAWSGEQFAYLDPNSPIFNEAIIAHLKKNGFSATKKGDGIRVTWGTPKAGAK